MIYKTLLFDLDSTLWDFHSAENYALTKLLEQQGVEDVEAYIDVYVPMNRAMWRSLEKDEITREELVETRFAKLFDHFGFEKDGKELAADYEAILGTQGQTYKGVIIGDSLTADIQGGINAGIDTIWMNLAAKENRTAIKPTVEVRSYAELLEFLV